MKSSYPHGDLGFHRLTGTPENQREEREKDKEAENKGEKIATTRQTLLALFAFEKTFFFDDITFLPRILRLAMTTVLAGSWFQRSRKPTGRKTCESGDRRRSENEEEIPWG